MSSLCVCVVLCVNVCVHYMSCRKGGMKLYSTIIVIISVIRYIGDPAFVA